MIFRRTFFNEIANSTGGVFTVLFSIVLTVGMVRVLGQAAGGRVGSTTVFELVVYTSLTNLPPLIAVAVFIAVLMVLIRSWQESEMVVWFTSGGVNLLNFIRPVLRFTIPIVVITAVLSLWVSPWAKMQIERATAEFQQKDDVNQLSPGRFIESSSGNRVLFIDEVDESGTRVKGVFMSEVDHRQEIIVHAETGELKTGPHGDRYIVLHNGHRYESSGLNNMAWKIYDFETYEVRIEVKAEVIYSETDVDMIPLEELWEMKTPIAYAQILWRLCWPVAVLNLALLAIPLSYTNPRVSRSFSLVAAVLIFILYLNGISVMQTWVKTERITWEAGVLLVNGGVALLAVLLFIRRVWMQRWVPLWLSELPFRLVGAGKEKA